MSKQAPHTDSLDFDFWMQLARNDPEAFEKSRQKKIEELISQAPAGQRRRLRGLQWQIDQTRKLAGSPMASCLAISNMMWDSFYLLHQKQRELTMVPRAHPEQMHNTSPTANVLAFPG